MSKLQFSKTEIEKVQEGNTINVYDKIMKHLEGGNAIRFGDIQKLAFQRKDTFESYKHSIKTKFNKNAKVTFAVDQAESEKQANILTEVSTEALLRDNSLLSRLNIREQSSRVPYIRMREFDVEQDAEVLGNTAPGTPANEVLRIGDKLMAETDGDVSKVQSSFVINELSTMLADGASIMDYQRRLTNRVSNKVIDRILYAGEGVGDGTARQPGQIRGIVNNYGVNGDGDATNYIGAIEYADAAAVDTATGLTSANPYDVVYNAKSLLLPKNVSDAEEGMYILVGNRKSWGKIKTAKDLNGRYLVHNANDPAIDRPVPMVDGTPFFQHTSVADDFVFLIPPSFYTLFMIGGIRELNDGGLVLLKEGQTTFVSRTYIDGSMNYGFKYTRGTTGATIGTTASNNQDQNAFRYFGIV